MKEEKENHIIQLDGLRGIAILLVLFFHLFNYGIFEGVFWFGWSGVDLFFVLSGFLISGILLNTRRKKGYYKYFLARRALRTLPLYYGVLIVFSIVAPMFSVTSWFKEYQLYFWTHTSNYLVLQKGFFLPLGHFWSLAIEEQFYLVWPLLILIFTSKQIIYLSLILLVSALGIRYYCTNPFLIFGLPLAHLDGMVVGTIISVLFKEHKKILFKFIPQVLIFCILGLVIYASLIDSNKENLRFEPLTLTLISIFFGSVLVLAFRNDILKKILSKKILVFFGKYSYGMYVFNSIFFHYANWAGADRLTGNGKLGAYSLVFILTIAVSYLVFNLYEIRFLRLKNKLKPALN